MTYYAISSQKVRTPHTLKQEGQNNGKSVPLSSLLSYPNGQMSDITIWLILTSQGPFINYEVDRLASRSMSCIKKIDPKKGLKHLQPPSRLAHEFMLTHIHMHVDSCAYLIILNTLTCRYTIIEQSDADKWAKKETNLQIREGKSAIFLKLYFDE